MFTNMQINGEEKVAEDEDALRLPKTTSYAGMANRPELRPREQPTSSVFAYTVARGRGRGRGQNIGGGAQLNGVQTRDAENGTNNSGKIVLNFKMLDRILW